MKLQPVKKQGPSKMGEIAESLVGKQTNRPKK